MNKAEWPDFRNNEKLDHLKFLWGIQISDLSPKKKP